MRVQCVCSACVCAEQRVCRAAGVQSGGCAVQRACRAACVQSRDRIACPVRSPHRCDQEGDSTPLHVSAALGDIKTVKRLLGLGLDPNLTDVSVGVGASARKGRRSLSRCEQGNGDTPLHIAAFMGATEIAAALHKAGADPEKANKVCVCVHATPGRRSPPPQKGAKPVDDLTDEDKAAIGIGQ